MISESINRLVQYGLDTGLISEEDRIYTVNRILEVLEEDSYEEPAREAAGIRPTQAVSADTDSSTSPAEACAADGGTAAPAEIRAADGSAAAPAEIRAADGSAAAPAEIRATDGSAAAPAETCAADGGSGIDLEATLAELLDFAAEKGLLENNSVVYRDLFDTKLMGCLVPRPSEVNAKFFALYREDPKKATDYFYKLSQDTDYIRRYRIKKDIRWKVPSEYGDIDISINLSKPEKDPKAIAAAKKAKQSGYPKCLLCKENVGYAGRVNHPARQNHRTIPLTINGTPWGFQYSPYVYYNEHCILFNEQHIPMKIERATFVKLFDFIKLFPHYFIGSNADLPIVGGSILSHDHYQGGNYTFAMAKAPIERHVVIPGFKDVEAGIVKWPLSVIRIRHADADRLIDLAEHILNCWRGYTDEDAFILAETDGEPHNTITPIARKVGDTFELDLALRNNITTEECPLGYYHPHAQYHHIKKENIGLIEVMGLAVLPARLKDEMQLLSEYLLEGKDVRSNELLEKHADWVEEFLPRHPELNAGNVTEILHEEIGKVFVGVLEDAGVYKCTSEGREAFMRFIQTL